MRKLRRAHMDKPTDESERLAKRSYILSSWHVFAAITTVYILTHIRHLISVPTYTLPELCSQ